MNKTLIAGAIFALASNGAMAAKPTDGTDTGTDLTPRVETLETDLDIVESDLSSQDARIFTLEGQVTAGIGNSEPTYRYVGTTEAMFTWEYNNPTTSAPIFQLTEACKAEFGANARFARSKEIASALDDGSFTAISTPSFIWPSDVSYAGTTAYDPHLNVVVYPKARLIVASPTHFWSITDTGRATASVACSAQ